MDVYADDVQGFLPYVNELRMSVFKFRPGALYEAKNRFQNMKNTYIGARNQTRLSDITMISIHIRLTDYVGPLKFHYGQKYVNYLTKDFPTQAMKYCTTKYKVM